MFVSPLFVLFHNDQLFYIYSNETKLFCSAITTSAQHRGNPISVDNVEDVWIKIFILLLQLLFDKQQVKKLTSTYH